MIKSLVVCFHSSHEIIVIRVWHTRIHIWAFCYTYLFSVTIGNDRHKQLFYMLCGHGCQFYIGFSICWWLKALVNVESFLKAWIGPLYLLLCDPRSGMSLKKKQLATPDLRPWVPPGREGTKKSFNTNAYKKNEGNINSFLKARVTCANYTLL